MERLVDTDKLQKIMMEMVGIFQKYKLNDLEIAFVTAELARLNSSYQVIKNKNLPKDL